MGLRLVGAGKKAETAKGRGKDRKKGRENEEESRQMNDVGYSALLSGVLLLSASTTAARWTVTSLNESSVSGRDRKERIDTNHPLLSVCVVVASSEEDWTGRDMGSE